MARPHELAISVNDLHIDRRTPTRGGENLVRFDGQPSRSPTRDVRDVVRRYLMVTCPRRCGTDDLPSDSADRSWTVC